MKFRGRSGISTRCTPLSPGAGLLPGGKPEDPAKIYYKFEGNNTSGSHKLNSAIAQAFYAKDQGLKGVTTETGAGQWGTALSMACSYLDLDCIVFMVKCSYEQKPFRREVMRTYGASVTPSPSDTTAVGRKILAEHPGTTGSLGCAISEAVEVATSKEGYRRCGQRGVPGRAPSVQYRSGDRDPIHVFQQSLHHVVAEAGSLFVPFMGEKLRETDYRCALHPDLSPDHKIHLRTAVSRSPACTARRRCIRSGHASPQMRVMVDPHSRSPEPSTNTSRRSGHSPFRRGRRLRRWRASSALEAKKSHTVASTSIDVKDTGEEKTILYAHRIRLLRHGAYEKYHKGRWAHISS